MPKTSAVTVPQSLSNDDLMALLGQAGMISSGGGGFRRMSLTSGSLVTDPGEPNEESWPPTKKGPTMTVRIVKPPVYYNAFFLDVQEKNGAIDPRRIEREDLDKRFVKKYDDPNEQAADQWSNVEVYDQLVEVTGGRGSFKADIQLQIVPDSGELTGDEPVYTLSLSTTSALDWRGSSKNPQGGIVQEKNFIVQLAELAQQQFIENGGEGNPSQAILDAMTSLRLGGVVAEVYLVLTSNPNKPSQTWTVVAFKPIHIEPLDQLAQLTDGATEDVAAGPETNSDDLPF
jgi:hypothetical protein